MHHLDMSSTWKYVTLWIYSAECSITCFDHPITKIPVFCVFAITYACFQRNISFHWLLLWLDLQTTMINTWRLAEVSKYFVKGKSSVLYDFCIIYFWIILKVIWKKKKVIRLQLEFCLSFSLVQIWINTKLNRYSVKKL